MATALVTGHTGFVGGWLIRYLRARGWDVRGFSRSEGELNADGCDVVFHLAANVTNGDPAENVPLAKRVLAEAERCGAKVVFASTMKLEWNMESTGGHSPPVGVKDPYVASKREVEALARDGDAVIRFCTLIGGNDWSTRLIPTLMTKWRVQVGGSTPLIHVLDACQFYEATALRPAPYGVGIRALSGGTSYRVEDIASLIAPSVEREIVCGPNRSVSGSSVVWTHWNILTALSRTVRFYKEQRLGADLENLYQHDIQAYIRDMR